jgi:hypothetical protein
MTTHRISHFKENLIDDQHFYAALHNNNARNGTTQLLKVAGAPMNLTRSSSALYQGSTFMPKKHYTLVYVIKKGYFNLVRHLLELGLDPNHVSERDDAHHLRCPLIHATLIRDDQWAFTVAQTLLEHGATLRTAEPERRLTALHYACAFARPRLLELFLNSLDFDLATAVDINGNSCLHYAMRAHSLNCLQLLIRKYSSYYTIYHQAPVRASYAATSYSERDDYYYSINEKLNARNKLGLRPIDLGEEIESGGAAENNFVYSGRDSLALCRNTLVDFLSVEFVAKMKREAAAIAAAMAAAAAAEAEVRYNARVSSKGGGLSATADESATTVSDRSASSKKGSRKTKSVARKPDNELINELDEMELSKEAATTVVVSVPLAPKPLAASGQPSAAFISIYEVSQEIKISPKTSNKSNTVGGDLDAELAQIAADKVST